MALTPNEKEVLEFVRENEVKFIKLGFCDPLGVQKNMSIMATRLEQAFLQGVSFDASSVSGFSDVASSDLLLFPDPTTLTVLPWRPGPGTVVRFYCDIKTPDKKPFSGDGRAVLRRVLQRGDEMGISCNVGVECEFYLFNTDDKGEPTYETLDKGSYFDISPLDRGENIRREVCLSLEEMGLMPESSHHENGPGQNEIDFKYSDPLSSADNLMTFKSVVKAIAARNGVFASFMPKPLKDESGSGLHINMSLFKKGKSLVERIGEGGEDKASMFLAGVMERAREMTLFLNPTANSYERLGKMSAPAYVSWSRNNRSQFVRIPHAEGDRVRMELRSPDPTINPFLAFALIISAGLDGIERGLKLPAPVDVDLYTAASEVTEALIKLPESMESALAETEKSDFVKEVLGEDFTHKYLQLKRRELIAYESASNKSDFFTKRYFNYY